MAARRSSNNSVEKANNPPGDGDSWTQAKHPLDPLDEPKRHRRGEDQRKVCVR
jgi:hypothetical protein